jgi:type IV pilus assembly protein PilN
LRGGNIDVSGVAEDNSRISEQLRAFDGSLWFKGGNVTSINAFPQAGPEASRFELSVEVSAPSAGAEGS